MKLKVLIQIYILYIYITYISYMHNTNIRITYGHTVLLYCNEYIMYIYTLRILLLHYL